MIIVISLGHSKLTISFWSTPSSYFCTHIRLNSISGNPVNVQKSYTVGPPNSGRVGTIDVIPYSEVEP